MPKFLSTPIPVEAYQVPPNCDVVAWVRQHCGKATIALGRSGAYVWVTIPRCVPVGASPGDWLVHSAQGLTVCADAEFHAGFRRAEA